MLADHRRDERIAGSGWFPHPALPLNDIDEQLTSDAQNVDRFVRDHVEKEWQSIRATLLESSAFQSIDASHRETMRQTIVAHEAALYRCIPRTLFGEIEMAARIVLIGLPLNNAINASLKPVLNLIGDLPVTAFPADIRAGAIYALVIEQIYLDSRRLPTGAALPNRHNHIHGYSRSHADFKDSLNMLLISEVMFRILAIVSKIVDDSIE